jgi:four helix bundle protein
MGPIRDFRDLIVWQKAVTFGTLVYKLSEGFPPDERFGLTAQIRRASVSVSSNIAEGHARRGDEFRRFLSIAVGSTAEAQSQMLVAVALGFVQPDAIDEAFNQGEEIKRIAYSLMDKV